MSTRKGPSAKAKPAAPALYPVERGEKTGFIDSNGNLVVDYRYDGGMFSSGGFAGVCVGEKWGFSNSVGELVIPPTFDEVRPFAGGFAMVEIKDKYAFIDGRGRFLTRRRFGAAADFSEGFAAVGSSTFCDRFLSDAGRVLDLAPAPDGECPGFSDGLARVEYVFERLVFIDRQGKEVFSLPDKAVGGDIELCGDFSEGLAEFTGRRSRFGYLDKTGSVAIKPQFEMALPFREGLAPVSLKGKYGYINKGGDFVVEPAYHLAQPFSSGLGMVKQGRHGPCGFVDTAGQLVIDLHLDSADEFHGELCAVSIGGWHCYINHAGTVVWPRVAGRTIMTRRPA